MSVTQVPNDRRKRWYALDDETGTEERVIMSDSDWRLYRGAGAVAATMIVLMVVSIIVIAVA